MAISYDQLISVLHYNKSTGNFTWLKNGKSAGYIDKDTGYVKLMIDGKNYYAHKLAEFYINRIYPENSTTHKDGNRSNNKWSNIHNGASLQPRKPKKITDRSNIPCKKCGLIDKGVAGRCNPCAAIKRIEYQLDNKEKIKENWANYYQLNKVRLLNRSHIYAIKNNETLTKRRAIYWDINKEKLKLKSAEWRARNTLHLKIRKSKWDLENKDLATIYRQNRRARVNNYGGVLSTGIRLKLFKNQRGLCPCCNEPLGKNYHLDHIMPLALGGSNTDENVQLLRAKCNLQKHIKHPVDFMQERGFLL